jgi:multidrug resistance efflux pump
VHVKAGDLVSAGQPVMSLAEMGELQARTVDLNELDIVHIAVGQPAVVTVDALPEKKIPGHVSEIGVEAENYRGDVTYPVTIVLDEEMPGLRLGMSALVKIERLEP